MSAAPLCSEVDDHRFMARALQLAEQGYYSARPNPRVGCVIAKNGVIVGEGFHYRAGEAHAEVNALGDAQARARGATAYVTLEPCSHHGRTPPCADALIVAGVSRVVYAMDDPNPKVAGSGAGRLRDASIEVRSGLMASSAASLNRGFVRRMQAGVPFVTLKIGMTMDAKIALESGISRWITSPEARADVQRLRAAAGAVLTGIGTVLADDPALTVRDPRFDIGTRQPLRVILDTELRASSSSKVFSELGGSIVFTARDVAPDLFGVANVSVEQCPRGSGGLDLSAVLHRLAELEINELLVEAGPHVVDAFLEQGLVDELVVYVAPKIFGSGAREAFLLAAPFDMGAATSLTTVDVRKIGPDIRWTLVPAR